MTRGPSCTSQLRLTKNQHAESQDQVSKKLCTLNFVDGKAITFSRLSEHVRPSCLVLCVHGYFSANRLGPNRIFVDLELLLRPHSVPVVRYDWPGMGESLGSMRATTLTRAVGDLLTVRDYAYRHFGQLPTIFVAHSLGVPVLLEFATNTSAENTKLVLLAPGPLDHKTMTLLCPRYSAASAPERKGLKLSGHFLRQIVEKNWYRSLAEISFPTLVLVARNDRYCCLDELSKIDRPEYKLSTLSTGRHNFVTLEAKQQIPLQVLSFIDHLGRSHDK